MKKLISGAILALLFCGHVLAADHWVNKTDLAGYMELSRRVQAGLGLPKNKTTRFSHPLKNGSDNYSFFIPDRFWSAIQSHLDAGEISGAVTTAPAGYTKQPFAQNPADVTTREFAATCERVVVMDGDSIVAGPNPNNDLADRLYSQVATKLGSRPIDCVVNVAVGGKTIAELLSEQPAKILDLTFPENAEVDFFISAGTNDIAHNETPAADIMDDLLAYVDAIHGAYPTAKVFVATQIARLDDATTDSIKELNDLIRVPSTARAHEYFIVDWGELPEFADTDYTVVSNRTYYKSDDEHPEPAGISIQADAVVDQIENQIPEPPYPGMVLAFRDEFDKPGKLDPRKWSVRRGDNHRRTKNQETGELQAYRDANCLIRNGALEMTLKAENVTDLNSISNSTKTFNYTSCYASSHNKFNQRWGYWEAKYKIPDAGMAVWPAFWTLPDTEFDPDYPHVVWPDEGEIDWMETRGQEKTELHTSYHYGPPWPDDENKHQQNSVGDFTGAYHVYGGLWSPSDLVYKYDNAKVFRFNTGKYPLPTLPHYTMLQLALGGSWLGTPNETTILPAVQYVDWVRVWKFPDTDIKAVVYIDGDSRHELGEAGSDLDNIGQMMLQANGEPANIMIKNVAVAGARTPERDAAAMAAGGIDNDDTSETAPGAPRILYFELGVNDARGVTGIEAGVDLATLKSRILTYVQNRKAAAQEYDYIVYGLPIPGSNKSGTLTNNTLAALRADLVTNWSTYHAAGIDEVIDWGVESSWFNNYDPYSGSHTNATCYHDTLHCTDFCNDIRAGILWAKIQGWIAALTGT